MLIQIKQTGTKYPDFEISKTGYLNQVSDFRAKVPMFFEKKGYIIKTAENTSELIQALRIRYAVFYKELLEKSDTVEIDIDEFDAVSDHLILINKNTNDIVGTYRLNSTIYSKKFYSENEFDLDNIKNLPGIKMELGRACILKEQRDGITIVLLFMGLFEYLKLTNARYLFGCSSLKTSENKKIALVYRYLRDHYLASKTSRAYPIDKYLIENFETHIKDIENSGYDVDYQLGKRMTPSLIGAYLQLGAKICGEPAYDADFKCADFMTLLNVSDLNMQYLNMLFNNA